MPKIPEKKFVLTVVVVGEDGTQVPINSKWSSCADAAKAGAAMMADNAKSFTITHNPKYNEPALKAV